jgi:Zn-dependent peptidase ImmA (M78 family)
MTRQEIEKRVEAILDAASVQAAPVPVEDIATKGNIQISRAPSKSFSGVLFRKEDTAFIALNSKESLVRQRITIAHELGHYYLHPNKNTFVEFRDNQKNIVRGTKEIEANKFAACLLMPQKLLEQDISTIAPSGILKEHVTFLAQKYQVSEDAMTYRLMNFRI